MHAILLQELLNQQLSIRLFIISTVHTLKKLLISG